MNKIFLFIISFIIISLPVMAFSDSFEDNTFNAWTTIAGAPIISVIDGEHWAVLSAATNDELYKYIPSTKQKSWIVYFDPSSTNLMEFNFRYEGGGSKCTVYLKQNLIYVGSVGGLCAFGAYGSQALPVHTAGTKQYKLQVDDLGTTMQISIYNASVGNSSLINTQTISFSQLTATNDYSVDFTSSGAGLFYLNSISTSIVASTSTSQITFDKSSYISGDNVLTNWTITDDDWHFYDAVNLNWYDSVVSEPNLVQTLSIGTQTGTYPYPTTKRMQLYATLCKGIPYLQPCSVFVTSSVQVFGMSSSYLLSNASYRFRESINITGHIGYSLSGYCSTCIYVAIKDNETGNIVQYIFPPITNDWTQSASDEFPIPVGRYSAILYDVVENTQLYTLYFSVIDTPLTIRPLGVGISNITTNANLYYMGEYMTVQYRVDDYNYSHFSIKAIINNSENITTQSFYSPLSSQTGYFQTIILPNPRLCENSKRCWVDSGANHIALIGYNTLITRLLAISYFNVTKTTLDGWGLLLSSQDINTTEPLGITVIVPTGGNGVLKILDAGYNSSAASIYQANVPTGTTKYQTTIKRVNINGVGYYDVVLIDSSNGITKMHIPLTVRTAAGTTGGILPATQGLGSPTSTTDILGSGWFIGGILITIFLIAGASVAGATGAIGGLGIGVIFSFLGGLIPIWGLFVFVLLVIAMIAFSLAGGMTKTGGGD